MDGDGDPLDLGAGESGCLGLGLLFAGLGSWRLLCNLHRQGAAPVVEVRRP